MNGVSQTMFKPVQNVRPAKGWRKRKQIMKKSDGGKGSSPRPYSVSQEEYAKRWDAIFQRDVEDETGDEDIDSDPDDSDSEDTLRCPKCGGVDTMYRRPHWHYNMCDQCGWTERLPVEEP